MSVQRKQVRTPASALKQTGRELAPGEALTWGKHRLVRKDFELFAELAVTETEGKSISKMSSAAFLCTGKAQHTTNGRFSCVH